jgi:hypothetical protein
MTNKKVPISAPWAINWASAHNPTHFNINNPTLGKVIRGTLWLESPDISVSLVIRTGLDVRKKVVFDSRQRKCSVFSHTYGYETHSVWYSVGTESSLVLGKYGCGVKSHRSPDLTPRLITSVSASPPPITSWRVKEKLYLDVYFRTILAFNLRQKMINA